MPCTPDKQFPGAWPESLLPPSPSPIVMDLRASPLCDSPVELRRPSSSSFSSGLPIKKPPPLRITVPPTEYCPFSTDLTLPSTPRSLPTPVSSSCFTFSDRQEPINQSVSVPPAPDLTALSCPCVTTIPDFASPTSSEFLLMPPTPHLDSADNNTAIRMSPPATNEPIRHKSGPHETKSENLRPWKASSSTWLSDLGGHTETDRIFRHNLLGMTSIADTESSPASTPALTPSAITPSSQVSSALAYNSPTSVVRSPASSPAASSPYPCTMSPRTSLPARLILKPTGTDTFPSTLDSLQAWREGVTPGLPRSEEPHSPVSEDAYNSQLGEPMPNTSSPSLPSPGHQSCPHRFLPPVHRAPKSRTFIKHAKMFGGRVKRLVTRKNVNRHRNSMDQGVNFRVVTRQDSENGSVILVAAPPPPYDSRSPTLTSHNPVRSEYSAVQTSTLELTANGMAESGPRQNGSNHTLRRLSLAALSTIKRI